MTKTKTSKKVAEANKAATTQKVIVRRKLDYIYPKGLTDPLKRKEYRAKVRRTIERLQKEMRKLKGDERKAKKAELIAYNQEHKTVPLS